MATVAVIAVAGTGVAINWLDAAKIEQLAKDSLAPGPERLLEIGHLERSIGMTLLIVADDVTLTQTDGDRSRTLFAVDSLVAEIELLPLLLGRLRLNTLELIAPRINSAVAQSPDNSGGKDRSGDLMAMIPERLVIEDLEYIAGEDDDVVFAASEILGRYRGFDALFLRVRGAHSRRVPVAINRLLAVTTLPGKGRGVFYVDGKMQEDSFQIAVLSSGETGGAADSETAIAAELRHFSGRELATGRLRMEERNLAVAMQEVAGEEGHVELEVERTEGGWRLPVLSVSRGDIGVRGRLEWTRGGSTPLVAGELRASGIDWPVVETEPGPDDDNTGGTSSVMSTDLGKRLGKIDVDLDLDLENINLYGVPVDRASLPLRSSGPTLIADPWKARLLDGAATGRLAYRAGDGDGDLEFRARIERLRAADLLRALGTQPRAVAGIAAEANLSSRGGNPETLLDALSGNVRIVADGGSLDATLTTLLDADIVGLLLDAADGDERTPLRCGIVALRGANGVFDSEAIVLDTGSVKLIGEGRLDFASRSLDLLLVPHGKDFDLLSASAPVQLKGKLTDPEASLAMGKALGSLFTPVELGLTDNADCQKLMEKGSSKAPES